MNSWISQQVKQFVSNSKCSATLTCRNWGAFRLHQSWSSATNVKSLQTTKLVILQYFRECMRICLLQWMSWHARWGMTKWCQLDVLVTRRTWLWWDCKENWSCKWHRLVHSQVKRLSGAHYLPSSNLKSLNFLLQCFIKSYIR